jgi:3-oxoacyl-[acyl-carrier-protein] synthase II
MNERVVITGIGVVTSIGTGRKDFWDALIAGKSGISQISSFDTSEFSTHLGGEVKDFDPGIYSQGARMRSVGRASQLAVAASVLAVKDAQLSLDQDARFNTGVVLGTTMAESQIFQKLNASWIKDGITAIDVSQIGILSADNLARSVAEELSISGPTSMVTTACAAGNYAIGYAFDRIRLGQARLMLAGGSDAFSRIAFIGFNRLLAVAADKVRPFDKDRKGMMVGEGSGVLVIESLESALKRNAPVYAEILGYGLSCDAHHMTAPYSEGIAEAIEKSLKESGVASGEVDYFNAHGTGTPANDKEECLAIKKVFGEHYKKLAVSSIKSSLGHTMGAASAIEAAACALAVKNDVIPPTINFQTPDPDCDIDCVPNSARKQKVDIALNSASAFGGNNACLVLKKFLA